MPGEGPHAPLRNGQRPGDGHPAAPEQRAGRRPSAERGRIGSRNLFAATKLPSAQAQPSWSCSSSASWRARGRRCVQLTPSVMRCARSRTKLSSASEPKAIPDHSARTFTRQTSGLAFQAWESDRPQRARELLEQWRPNGQADLRGFEWRYLHGLTRPTEKYVFTSSSRQSVSSALSPDNHFLAMGDYDGRIDLWDFERKQLLSTCISARASFTQLRSRQTIRRWPAPWLARIPRRTV